MDGIILAGGKSTRMGTNKLLINVNGHPLLWHTIQSMKPFVNHLVVVTGRYDKEIREALKEEKDIEIVTNDNYEKGMFTSVQTGIRHINDSFFLIPGDCPFVSEETYQSLLNGKGDIRVPRYKDTDGHPIYIDIKYKEEILLFPLDSNLKQFRDSKKYEIINVRDKNIVINLNTVLDVINIKNWKEW